MTSDASPAGSPQASPADDGYAGQVPHARFEFLRGGEGEPATVRAAGDIDLTNVGRFQAALDEAAACGAITVDMTAVTYCDSAAIRVLFIVARRAPLTIRVSTPGAITRTLLEVSGLDKIATVVTRD
jgi:anti-anti-sigma factor